MKAGRSLQELAVELDRQNNVKKDYVADTRELQMVYDDRVTLKMGGSVFGLNETAHSQIGNRIGIPSKYYDKMLAEEPELLVTNVNTWFNKQPAKRMVRTLDGTARAFLSNRYRRIDNHEIVQAVFPMIAKMKDARVESCELTDSRMYIKVVSPRVETEVTKGDVVQSGILISNSEVGLGSVSVQPLVYRLVCKNGMIANAFGKKSRHTGRSVESDDSYEIYRSETVEADDRAFIMKLQDIVRAAIDVAQFERIVSAMKLGVETKITGDIPTVVELAAKAYNIQEKETQGVLDYLIRGGDLSLYGLSNAITYQAQLVDSYDRSTDLEQTAWEVLTMPRNRWKQLNQAA